MSALEYSIFKRTRVGASAGAVDRCTQGCFEFVPKMEQISNQISNFSSPFLSFFVFSVFIPSFFLFSPLGKRSDDSSLFFISEIFSEVAVSQFDLI